jgi:hypothetical protein
LTDALRVELLDGVVAVMVVGGFVVVPSAVATLFTSVVTTVVATVVTAAVVVGAASGTAAVLERPTSATVRGSVPTEMVRLVGVVARIPDGTNTVILYCPDGMPKNR